jgi:glutamate--cysteine ligase
LPFAWQRDATFRSYIEWALDVPMFLVKRGDRILPATHLSFRQFMRDGLSGHRATAADWETHLNTLFPEARLKRTLELRGADAQTEALLSALPALWKGLLYDGKALDAAEALITDLDARTLQAARLDIVTHGFDAKLLDKPVRVWAERTLEIARAGLQRIADRNAAGQDESLYLEPLIASVAAGKTPAQLLLEATASAADWRAALVAATRVC